MAKYFETEDDMIEVLTKMDETDVKSVSFIDEGKLVLITDKCPILSPDMVADAFDIKARNENDPSSVEETNMAIEDAINGTGCMWIGPVNGLVQSVPVAEVAVPSLCGRAGLFGPSIKILPTILNYGFNLHGRTEENKTKTLIRDGRLIASHSNKYQWLPQGQLVSTNREVFKDLFGDYEFITGEYTEEITYAVYSFPGKKAALTSKYNKAMSGAGWEEVTPAVCFSTSDVTKSGANLYPMMIKEDGRRIRLGSSIKLSHDGGHTMIDYADNAYRVYTMLQENTKLLEKMLEIKLLYPENAYQNAVKRYNLPIGAANKAFEDFTMRRGAEVTANDLYWSLWNLTSYLDKVNATKLLDVEEQLSKLFYADWKRLDTAIRD